MEEKHLLLVALVTVFIVSAVALVRLLIVLRIFRRRRRSSSISQYYSALYYSTNSNTLADNGHNSILHHQQQLGAGAGAGAVGAESRILLPSLLFHALVFLCLAAEVPVYVVRYVATQQSSTAVGRPLYALHLCSYLLLFCAFCVIVTLWSDVAVFEPNEWTALMNRSMLVLCLCYLVVTSVAVSVCLGLGKVQFFFSSVAFLAFCTYSIAALLLLGSCFLVLGCLLQRRICRVLVTGSCTPRLTARVVRLNVVMLACFICFTLRAFMLAALVQVEAEGEVDSKPSMGWKRWEWDLRLEWAPHVIPCIAMLYLMRKSGEPVRSEVVENSESMDFGGGRQQGRGDVSSRVSDGKEPSPTRYGAVARSREDNLEQGM